LRLARIALFTIIAVLAMAESAEGAISFHPCGKTTPVLCAKLDVPLDRSGAVPGTVGLQIRRVNALQPLQPPIFAFAGGPGQSATPFVNDIAYGFRNPLLTRDLIVFDQRGTGRSGLIRCPTLEGLGARLFRVAGAAADCAETLGPKRAFYTTPASVEDIEAIRAGIGAEKITLYGVSYGTKVALAYAARYPQHVDRLVLDSVVDIDGPDPYGLDITAALPRVLRRLCANGCEHVTRDPVADLAALVRKLSAGLIHGPIVKPDGRTHVSRLGRLRLFDMIVEGDFDPTLRSGLPGAIRSALADDYAPLLRMANRADRIESESVGSFDTAVFTATQCEEGPLPWDRTTPQNKRAEVARSRLAAVPNAALGPFDRSTLLLESGPFALCTGWPTAPAAPQFSTGPLPDVPALILSGKDDLRTPSEGAKLVAARLPHAKLLTVPDTGHDVLDTEFRGCSRRALLAFFADRPIDDCRHHKRLFAVEPIAPTSIAQVGTAGGIAGGPGRTAEAVRLTLRDMAVQLTAQLLSGDFTATFTGIGGLRGGRIAFTVEGVRLSHLVYVPGVSITGRINFAKRTSGLLRISGDAAAKGELRVRRDGSLSGHLGGRRVHFQIRNDALPGGGALLSRVKALSKVRRVRLP
jgi:pimeloyl-ACP methyl ester carboxylesterase